MGQPEREDSKLPITGILVLVAAVGGILWYQTPLKSSRPVGTGLEIQPPVGESRVQARLWQDPIAAAKEHARVEEEAKKDTPHHGIETLRKQITEKFKAMTEAATKLEVQAGKITVLLVMTNGAPYADAGEMRIRDRYAVVSALSVACFQPKGLEHIQYFRWDKEGNPPLLVPFEWYSPRSLRQCTKPNDLLTLSGVLVFWLQEEAFSLDQLYGLAHEVMKDLSSEQRRRVEFKIIGPRSSTGLWMMLSWIAFEQRACMVPRFQLFSPWATAAPELFKVALGKDSKKPAGQWLNEELVLAGVHIHYRIGTDFELVQALIEELGRRGVNAEKDHIALVHERDSFYGRTVPLEFTAVVCQKTQETTCKDKNKDRNHEQALELLKYPENLNKLGWIKRYTYLAGLDGHIPSQEPSKSDGGEKSGKDKSKGDEKDRKATLGYLERPEGQSQLDYIRRLAGVLEEENRKLVSQCSIWQRLTDACDGFKAIGVLAADVYDKLLILQALRQRFPKAIFFTTDLDERLTHPSQYEWTRNLIIASHFGLQLREAIQRGVPPFRDSYQTSAFFSVLQAVGQITGPPKARVCPDKPVFGRSPCMEAYRLKGTEQTFESASKPRLYEAGRSGVIDLSVDRSETTTIHEPRLSPLAENNQYILFAAALVIVLILLPWLWSIFLARKSTAHKENPPEKGFPRGRWIIGLGIILAAWFASQPLNSYEQRYELEPLYWFEGVSIWPSEAIRLIAALLGLYFLRKAHTNLVRSNNVLSKEFELVSVSSQAEPDQVDAVLHWRDYVAYGAGMRRAWRILPFGLAFLALAAILMGVFGWPHLPYRGDFSRWVHHVVGFSSIALLVLLIVYVVDAVWLCKRFIDRLAAKPTAWPRELLKKHESARNLDPYFLDDWLDIRFIARLTKAVGVLIYYPFIVLALMLIARDGYFDDWDFPVGLMAMYVLGVVCIVACAVLLRRAAEEARKKAVGNLKNKLFLVKGRGPKHGHVADQISLTIQEIEAEREGTFAPWAQHPVFGAVLFPSGGVGLIALLEYLLR